MNRKDFFKKYVPQDGWMCQFSFNGETEDESYSKLKEFLLNEGFDDIPLPPTARRLWWDYIKPNDDGNCGNYVWHPIKITQDVYQVNGLVLSIFNEDCPDHIALWEGTYGNDI
jgi:hypothetical protein